VFLYGDERRWSDIARWNQIKPPYPIEIGKKLRLEDQPIPSEEGRQRLIERWRAKMSAPSAYEIRRTVTPAQVVAEFRAEAQSKTPTPEARKEAAAEDLVKKSREALNKGDLVAATRLSRETRAIDPTNLTGWLTEIRSLLWAGKNAEAKKAAEELVRAHPRMAEIPLIQGLTKKEPGK
jgi:hypothetical protein